MSDRVGKGHCSLPDAARFRTRRLADDAARIRDTEESAAHGRVLEPHDRHVACGVDGELRVPGQHRLDVRRELHHRGPDPVRALGARLHLELEVSRRIARIGVEDPGCRRLAGGADRERQEPQDLIGRIGRRREVVDAPPRPGRGRVAARVHDVARRIQPDHGHVAHGIGRDRCVARVDAGQSRSCRQARMRRPARDGRPGGAGAHHPSETTRSPRIRWSSARGSARLRPRRRQRGSSRRSTVGRAGASRAGRARSCRR